VRRGGLIRAVKSSSFPPLLLVVVVVVVAAPARDAHTPRATVPD
jgi:hypothetical protein